MTHEGREGAPSGLSYWLILRDRPPGASVLTLGGAGEVLPVFGSEEGGLEFLSWCGEPEHLKPAPVTAGGLVRLLDGPRTAVRRVALDLSPEIMAEKVVDLVSLPSQDFVGLLLGVESF